MPSRLRPLWQCPRCGEKFVGANMWHSCGKFSLEALFVKSEPQVLRLFHRFAEMVRTCGPVMMIPQKTRVVFQVRVRFASAVPRKSYLMCSVALPERVDNSRFVKIETYRPRFYGHQFRVRSEDDLDEEVQ